MGVGWVTNNGPEETAATITTYSGRRERMRREMKHPSKSSMRHTKHLGLKNLPDQENSNSPEPGGTDED